MKNTLINLASIAILLTATWATSACGDSTYNYQEVDSNDGSGIDCPLYWTTVHETVSDGGVSLKVQATNGSLDAVPNLADLTNSEPVVAVVPGGGVVLDAAWAIAPQDTSLVDPWRIELTWDPQALTADESSSLAVITEAAAGGWRHAAVAEFSPRDGRAVLYASELGRVGLAAADLGADPAAFVAPAELCGETGEVVVDTLGDDKSNTDLLIEVDALIDSKNTLCVDFFDYGIFNLHRSLNNEKYSRVITFDTPNIYEFIIFQSSDDYCNRSVGNLYPMPTRDVEIKFSGIHLSDFSCLNDKINIQIKSALDITRNGREKCPLSSGYFGKLVTFRAFSISPSVSGGNLVCININGEVHNASNLGAGVYRFHQRMFLPQLVQFYWLESSKEDCSDTIRRFYYDNATMQINSSAVPFSTCLVENSSENFSFKVQISNDLSINSIGTQECILISCGNGYLQVGEECDDGDDNNNNECSNSCKIAKCGDGIIQQNESCDDGNLLNGDRCSALCETEQECYDIDISYANFSNPDSINTYQWADRFNFSCSAGTRDGIGDITYLWIAPHPGSWHFQTISEYESKIKIVPYNQDTCSAQTKRLCTAASEGSVFADYGERFLIIIQGRGISTLNILAPPVPATMEIQVPMENDARRVSRGNGLYNRGDYISSTRITSYSSVSGIKIDVKINPNSLSCDSQEMDVIINDVTVGRLSISRGVSVIEKQFSFDDIYGPIYEIIFRTVDNVLPGCGSANIDDTESTITLIQ